MHREALDKLLHLLGSDEETAAVEYGKLHERLSRFFEWNGAEDPTALADEAMDRLGGRAIEDNGRERIQNPSAFALGVARLLLQEEGRRQQKTMEAIRQREMQRLDSTSEAEEMDAALQRCLATMHPEQRTLLEQYYAYSSNEKAKMHRKLADELGLTINALRNRALRARQELESSMRKLLKEK